jgi:hypothetical protein
VIEEANPATAASWAVGDDFDAIDQDLKAKGANDGMRVAFCGNRDSEGWAGCLLEGPSLAAIRGVDWYGVDALEGQLAGSIDRNAIVCKGLIRTGRREPSHLLGKA